VKVDILVVSPSLKTATHVGPTRSFRFGFGGFVTRYPLALSKAIAAARAVVLSGIEVGACMRHVSENENANGAAIGG